MSAASAKVLELRQLLAERFGSRTLLDNSIWATGLPALDEIGIPRGAITEIVSSAQTPGGSLLLYGLIHTLAQQGERIALIDGAAAFQPKDLSEADLRRLLLSQCRNANQAIQAADLAARDGNFAAILLLLTLNPKDQLRRIPGTTWHRLQMLVEKSATALLTFTSFPQVGSARLRLTVAGAFPLADLHIARADLLPVLRLQVERRRQQQERYDDERLRRPLCA